MGTPEKSNRPLGGIEGPAAEAVSIGGPRLFAGAVVGGGTDGNGGGLLLGVCGEGDTYGAKTKITVPGSIYQWVKEGSKKENSRFMDPPQ